MATEEASAPSFFTLFPLRGQERTISAIHWLCHSLVELPHDIRDTILGFYYSYLIGITVESAYHEKALEFAALHRIDDLARRLYMNRWIVQWFLMRQHYARHITCRFAKQSFYAHCFFSIPQQTPQGICAVEKCRRFYEEANRFGHPLACYGIFMLFDCDFPLCERLRTFPYKDGLLHGFPQLFTYSMRGEWYYSPKLADTILVIFHLLVEEKRGNILRDAIHQHFHAETLRLSYPRESQKVLDALYKWGFEDGNGDCFDYAVELRIRGIRIPINVAIGDNGFYCNHTSNSV